MPHPSFCPASRSSLPGSQSDPLSFLCLRGAQGPFSPRAKAKDLPVPCEALQDVASVTCPPHPPGCASLLQPGGPIAIPPRHVPPQDICTSSAWNALSLDLPLAHSSARSSSLPACHPLLGRRLQNPTASPPPILPVRLPGFIFSLRDRPCTYHLMQCLFSPPECKVPGDREGFCLFRSLPDPHCLNRSQAHGIRRECEGRRTPGAPFWPLQPLPWVRAGATQKAQAAFSSGSPAAAPGSLSCLSLLPLLFHIHFLSLSQSFPLFGA